MSYAVISTESFDMRAKKLARKSPSFADDLAKLILSLSIAPQMGTALGQECYKIRLAITSKGKGKSGGARVITLVLLTAETVFLLDVFDKSEKATISDKELTALRRTVVQSGPGPAPNLPPPGSENQPSDEAL